MKLEFEGSNEEWSVVVGNGGASISSEVKAQLTRIEQKIDALAQDMTPAERAAIIAAIDAGTAKISAIADGGSALVGKINDIGKPTI